MDGEDVRVGQELIDADVLGVGDGGDPVVGRVSVIAEDLTKKQSLLEIEFFLPIILVL